MAKTILIPTDFTVRSLNLVKIALQKNYQSQEKLRIILVHGIMAPTSITELLFYSKAKELEELENAEFQASCKLLLGKFDEKIERMTIDLFSGFNQSAFENYLDANRVDEAYIPANYKLKLTSRSSFDLIPFFSKSKLPLTRIDLEGLSSSASEEREDALAALFFTQGQIAR
jgi:DNA polymerase elongation subunit (family B)